MVETVMYIALGFVAATLIALLIIPAINARAERLARRRAEALFPLSVSELTAEKDHLRAEFAVLQRKIERKADEALAVKHESMEELGRRAVKIEELETAVGERDLAVGGLQNELAEVRARLTATEEELTGATTNMSGARDTLLAIEEAHRKTVNELASVREELERTHATLAATKAELLGFQDKAENREVEFADTDHRHLAALSELDTKRITISDLETRLTTQMGRADDYERALAEHRTELAGERRRLADLAQSLLAEQERSLKLDLKVRELESERDDKAAEASSLSVRFKDLLGQGETLADSITGRDERILSLEAELRAARERIATLESRDKDKKETGDGEKIREENEALRRMIVDVADKTMRALESGTGGTESPRKAVR